jgi:hypothetical protein
MKKSTLLFLFLSLVISSVFAQPYYLRGDIAPCGWGNSSASCQLTDPDGDGIFTKTLTAADLGAAAVGYREFKIYNAAGAGSWFPGNNSWFVQVTGSSVTFRFTPLTNKVEAIESIPFSLCAPGDYITPNWTNTTPMTNVTGNTWCMTVANPGTYNWKPTACGSWGSWNATSPNERNSNSGNWAITTTTPNQQVCISYNPTTGAVVSTLPPPTGYYLRGNGPLCGWNNLSSTCKLTDPDGDGCFELTLDLGATPLGIKEFKIYKADGDVWFPANGNYWYNHTGGAMTFKICTPSNTVSVSGGNGDVTIAAPGNYIVPNWVNTTPAQRMGNTNMWCFNVPNAGSFSWKPTVSGTWFSWDQATGLPDAGAADWTINTNAPGQQICVTYDPISRRLVLSQAVPTMSQWGLLLFGFLMMILGYATVRQRSVMMAGGSNAKFSLRSSLPFNVGLYLQAMLMSMAFFITLFVIAMGAFNYQLTVADIPGSILATPILAYLVMLFLGEKKGKF